MNGEPQPAGDPLDRTRFPIDEWRLIETEHGVADLGSTETLFSVGNGYIGMRGNPEEGRPAHSHGTFINGFHEMWRIRHPDVAPGFARVGQTLINAPDAKVLKIYVDDEPLLLPIAVLHNYERSLDFKSGVLRRRLVWRTSAGKRVQIDTTRMISFTQRHLAIMTMTINMLSGDDASVVISSQLVNRQDGRDDYSSTSALAAGSAPRRSEDFERRVLNPQTQLCADGRLLLTFRSNDSRMTVAVGADHTLTTDNAFSESGMAEPDYAKQVYNILAKRHVPIHLEKLVTYHTSRNAPVRELADRCQRTLDRARGIGAEAIYSAQIAWLDRFWADCDVQLPGQPALQQAVRWNLFQLAQAVARAEGYGISGQGVTGSASSGHCTWETEVYVLPFLCYALPQAALCALNFRHTMLDSARRRSIEMEMRGALFPGRTINGEEASTFYAATQAHFHVNADIAFALMKYVHATDDLEFLYQQGADILIETARFWADVGFWRSNGTEEYHIHFVTGPDEYTTVVNDNFFTNVMARENLAAAAETVGELRTKNPDAYARIAGRLNLDPAEVEEWQRCAQAMFIPYDETLGVHPQDSHFLEGQRWDLARNPSHKRPLMQHVHPFLIYRSQVLKQADVIMAMLLKGDQFTHDQKRRNVEYYYPIITGEDPSSEMVQSIIAAETGYDDLALRYFYSGLFLDLNSRRPGTVDGVDVMMTAGVWAALVYGFGGMRDYAGKISFDPRLPKGWPELRFRLILRESRLWVRLTKGSIWLDVVSGPAVTVGIHGRDVRVLPGEPAEVSIPEDR